MRTCNVHHAFYHAYMKYARLRDCGCGRARCKGPMNKIKEWEACKRKRKAEMMVEDISCCC
jgi:hypothetical protein